MTENEINIAIAESMGWTRLPKKPEYIGQGKWTDPNGIPKITSPDYCNDLNAMHEAVETLPRTLRLRYAIEIMDACASYPIGCVPDWERDRQSLVNIAQATAAQRAEAYLKNINKFKPT